MSAQSNRLPFTRLRSTLRWLYGEVCKHPPAHTDDTVADSVSYNERYASAFRDLEDIEKSAKRLKSDTDALNSAFVYEYDKNRIFKYTVTNTKNEPIACFRSEAAALRYIEVVGRNLSWNIESTEIINA